MNASCVYCGNELSGHICYPCVTELNQEIAIKGLYSAISNRRCRNLVDVWQ